MQQAWLFLLYLRLSLFLIMDREIIFYVKDSPEGGFEAHALGQSIFTEADTLEELRAHIREAVHVHFEEGEAPKLIRLHYVKEELLSL